MVSAGRRATIAGTGSYLPGEPIGNDVIEALAGALPDEVAGDISIDSRHWIIDPETGAHHHRNTDLAVGAGRAALADAGVEPGDVDLLVVATATPEYPLPPMVNLVQDELGVGACATYELRSGGAGTVQALELVRHQIESGTYRTALVIGSEATSPVLAPIFLDVPAGKVRIRDRIPMYMFGDGAGAVVLRAGTDGGLVGGATGAIGSGRPPGIQVTGGGTHAPVHEQKAAKRLVKISVDVVAAGHLAPALVADAIGDTLTACDAGPEQVDVCVVPEGNSGWMREAMGEGAVERDEWSKITGEFADSLSRRGALGCAGPLVCLDDAARAGRIPAGARVLIVGIESSKWVHAGVLADWGATSGTSDDTSTEEPG
ncbi:3-oxoacyl-[acyl-carrier-protein] synthase-3 [Haloactinopolyspora alba]|uniref:3-oxoacyl-[acyl-carrier-protein] synthase-3 n=1 Tax=Haloactinopolyspora alba TaxID=648780 RepID=A0A2P8DYS4_9ACTN|nr:3-oxoacyl-ACP synthase III family protein [Haloactinopolyspora alba]PSL02365.1 3-oxoacyl-[acyl-carrier-protein] synthase-3 [Haloactinopolyspora alba]